jgi:organic radical activating enzyme
MTQHVINILNVDRNVSFRDYRHIEGTHLKVAVGSPFYTFQGEGPLAGHPVVFFRTAGCNIGAKEDCPWCDTKFFFDTGTDMTIEEAFFEIVKCANGRTKTIVVTGGEPLLQSASLENLAELCSAYGWHIQVESNGYFVGADTLKGHTLVVSPKIPHNKNTYLPYKRVWFERGVHLKYVVSADPQNKYHNLPADVLEDKGLFNNRLYVSAMCVYKRNTNPGEIPNIWDDTLVDRQATSENYAYAAELALNYGLKVSYQTHLFGIQS